MWPMDYRFLKDKAERGKVQRNANVMRSAAVKRQERCTFRLINQVLHKNPKPFVAIASITKMLSHHNKIENVLDKYTTDNSEHNMNEERVVCLKSRDLFSAGTPAPYLTHEQLIEKRKHRDMGVEEVKKQKNS